MFESLAALLCAHALADFLFQTRWMVDNKAQAKGLAAHGAVVLAATLTATGSIHPVLFWLTAVHLLTDLAKTRAPKGLTAFLADQGAHLLALLLVAFWQPNLWQAGLWATPAPWLPQAMALIAGLILTMRAGGFAIGLLMEPFSDASPDGLPGGGRVIGQLERGLIFALILLGQPEGVGLLIAAKSILRFGAVKDDRAASEYVIIGTLASFGWAILAAHATLSLLSVLPPLGILAATP